MSYNSDVTYGTNNEFGFDYLRDNMAVEPNQLVQRELNFCIVDEVDSILIDEARTPLIISGPAEDATEKYAKANEIAKQLVKNKDFSVDEKDKNIQLTEKGVNHIQDLMHITNLYGEHADWVHFLDNALRAWYLFEKDVDYIVRDGEIIIVDENTGRLMEGRRYSNGMHQAIEAKEGVQIRRENQTLATITFQNYFRMYKKLSGMTGTAETEATEFVKHPRWASSDPRRTGRSIRDQDDLVYRTKKEKLNAIVHDVKKRYEKGQPVLLGTASVESSELVSNLLTAVNVPHQVLNAKHHEKEAAIVAVAGRKGAVTVATNMAGRGTDIMLGGNVEFLADQKLREEGLSPDQDEYEAKWKSTLAQIEEQAKEEKEEVRKLGGLYVLGTERHESRRIDNQLRGRSGRQGDPGESRFYLSLEDNLMRLFNTQLVARVMQKGYPEGEPIESKTVSKGVRNAQKAVESRNFEIRKNVLKYDDVMNKQRTVIYDERQIVLKGADLSEDIQLFIEETIRTYVREATKGSDKPQDWNLAELHSNLAKICSVEGVDLDDIYAALGIKSDDAAAAKAADDADDAKDAQDADTTAEAEDNAEADADADGKKDDDSQKSKHAKALKGDKARRFIADTYIENAKDVYDQIEATVGSDALREAERKVVLATLDRKWREHLYEMDYLKDGIGLRGMGQRDPLVEYQREGYTMYNHMVEAIKEESIELLFHMTTEQIERLFEESKHSGDVQYSAPDDPDSNNADKSEADTADDLSDGQIDGEEPDGMEPKSVGESDSDEYSAPRGQVGYEPLSHADSALPANKRPKSVEAHSPWEDGRTFPGTKPNEKCPCGSGRKYKMCHGRNETKE